MNPLRIFCMVVFVMFAMKAVSNIFSMLKAIREEDAFKSSSYTFGWGLSLVMLTWLWLVWEEIP